MEPQDLDALLDRHRDRLREMLRELLEEQGEDPFRVELDDFLARSDEERAELVRRAAFLSRARTERELDARRAVWIVRVGDEVVASSADRAGIPSVDEVLELGRARNLVPYLFEAPLIEEIPATSTWTAVATGVSGDRYPTLPFRLGNTVIEGDLDTGSHGTLIDAGLREPPGEPPLWFTGRHLGRDFQWSPGRSDVAVALVDGSVHSASLPVRWVRNWTRSPFVRINPERKALVGRDALRALNVELVLRAGPAETRVIGASTGK